MSLWKQEPPNPTLALQEARPDPRVGADGVRDLVHVGLGRLAQGRDGVDRRDPLREERVGRQLRQLGAPDVRLDDALARHPAWRRGRPPPAAPRCPPGVSCEPISTRSGCSRSLTAVPSARNSGFDTTSKRRPAVVAVEDALHRLRRPDRQRGLLDHDLVPVELREDLAGGLLPVLQVGRPAGALAEGLRRRVDGHEDDVGVADAAGDVGREEQVAPAGPADHLVEARLVDRQRVAVPGGDARVVDVHDGDPRVRALVGDHGHGRAADVARADAEDVHGVGHGPAEYAGPAALVNKAARQGC